MLVPMTPVQIMTPLEQLRAVIAMLQRLGAVQLTGAAGQDLGLAPAGAGDVSRTAGLRTDADDLAALLGLAETAANAVADQDWLRPATATVPPERVDTLGPGLRPLLARREPAPFRLNEDRRGDPRLPGRIWRKFQAREASRHHRHRIAGFVNCPTAG